jgi:hypothetical protein
MDETYTDKNGEGFKDGDLVRHNYVFLYVEKKLCNHYASRLLKLRSCETENVLLAFDHELEAMNI